MKMTLLFKKIIEKIEGKNEKMCRICNDTTCEVDDHWIKPCQCKGTILWVHHNCLKKWIEYSNSTLCTTCNTSYTIKYDESNIFFMEKIIYNKWFIAFLSFYFMSVLYFILFKFSVYWNKIHSFQLIDWFYITRTISVSSILIYVTVYYFLEYLDKNLLENIELPDELLNHYQSMTIFGVTSIPNIIRKIIVNLLSKPVKSSQDFQILDFQSLND